MTFCKPLILCSYIRAGSLFQSKPISFVTLYNIRIVVWLSKVAQGIIKNSYFHQTEHFNSEMLLCYSGTGLVLFSWGFSLIFRSLSILGSVNSYVLARWRATFALLKCFASRLEKLFVCEVRPAWIKSCYNLLSYFAIILFASESYNNSAGKVVDTKSLYCLI